jgi:hypothetical protein
LKKKGIVVTQKILDNQNIKLEDLMIRLTNGGRRKILILCPRDSNACGSLAVCV